MKSFDKFIKEEVDLRKSKGIPSDFMSKAEQEARVKKGVRPDDESQMRNVAPRFRTFMIRSEELMQISNGRMITTQQFQQRCNQLEELAKKVVLEEFGDILSESSVPVELDIKLVKMGDVSRQIPNIGRVPKTSNEPIENIADMDLLNQPQPEQAEQELPQQPEECEECEPGQPPQSQQLNPQQQAGEDLAAAIDKKKILNMIAQGAGKKTKEIIRYSETVEEGLMNIFGNNATDIKNCWIGLSEEADKMDWIIPIRSKAGMMKGAPGGMAGACEVVWESLSGERYDLKLILEKQATKVIIKAVGVDFPMLIHEAVKGVYTFLQSVSIKRGEAAKIVKKATSSFTDEAQDFRYGPPALQMLIEFTNKFPESENYKQFQAKIYKFLAHDKERHKEQLKNIEEMAEKMEGNQKEQYKELIKRMKKRVELYKTDAQFLEIMKSLFSTFDQVGGEYRLNEDKFNESHAKKEIQEIVNFIVKEDEYLSGRAAEYERYKKAQEEAAKRPKVEEEPESEIDKLVRKAANREEDETEVVDYKKMSDAELSKLSQSEIQSAIDKAVEEENYEFADKLTKKFLKGEAKKVWETELQRINEMYKLHTRRK